MSNQYKFKLLIEEPNEKWVSVTCLTDLKQKKEICYSEFCFEESLKENKKNELVLYVDATCDQFGHFLKTEEYYLSTEKNKTFLYDEENFIYKKKITNSKLIKTIEFLEFEVKGRLFDFVRNLKNNMQASKKTQKNNTKV